MLGVECVQAYRLLAKRLRRGNEHYRDPGTIAAIIKRYERRGQLTEKQARDFLTAGHAGSEKTREPGKR
jgi:hypothetical protein